MTLAVTHRLMRRTVEHTTVERLNGDGTVREVEWDTHVLNCACGRVFRTESYLLSWARYLGHLPQPKAGES